MTRTTRYLVTLGAALTILGLSAPASAVDPPRIIRPYPGPVHRPAGLQVTHVALDSPAALAGLERGDVIVEVDDRRVVTPEQLHHALHRTGRRAELTVRDVRTGRLVRLHVFTPGGHVGVTVAPVAY